MPKSSARFTSELITRTHVSNPSATGRDERDERDLTATDWDPYKMQLVFGDGDEFLKNFTGTVDVIGHELTHAVTEAIAPLEYYGQSGALNEHISDVFGIIVKQRMERESAEKADWLIGEGCLVPGVKGVALRSMKAPGTAYDDPRFVCAPATACFSRDTAFAREILTRTTGQRPPARPLQALR